MLFGGAAGGGKSEALLMAALMFVDVPGYSAMIFRKTYADLSLPGALLDRAAEWLLPTGASYSDREKTWTFPSGATLSFGYLDGPRDRFRYQGMELQGAFFDEATQIRQEDYLYLFSRIRAIRGGRVPLRVRGGTNPGGISHSFFSERFVSPDRPDASRLFVPSKLEDNHHLDREEYERSLSNLDETTYRQLRLGEWIENTTEAIFKREWFDDRYAPEDRSIVNRSVARWISLDTAETKGQTSAYTALVCGELSPDYSMNIRYVSRKRMEFPELVEWTIEEAARFPRDGKLRGILIENASSGRQLIQTLLTSAPPWLRTLIVPVKPKGKDDSWRQASVWAKRGMTRLPEPSESVGWLQDFEAEVFAVPNSRFLDQADAYAQLVNHVEESSGAFSTRWRALESSATR